MGREITLTNSPLISGFYNNPREQPAVDPMRVVRDLFGDDPSAAQNALLQLQQFGRAQIANLLRSIDPSMFSSLQDALTKGTIPSTNTAALTDKYEPSTNKNNVQDALFKAVIVQESGGNYSAVNKDSGALGIGQVMPANVPSWSKEALGRSITPKEFLASPELQNKIIKFKLDQYYNEALKKGYSPDDAVRYVAAKWYSGRGENMNSTKPQNGYPSIRAYTMSVLGHYKKAKVDD